MENNTNLIHNIEEQEGEPRKPFLFVVPGSGGSQPSGKTQIVKDAGTVSSGYTIKTRVVGGVAMDESIKMLLDRMDIDMRDHKQEIRNRDDRLQAEFQERERRIHDEAKEREDRILSAMGDIKNEVTAVKTDITQNINSVRQDVAANTKHVQSLVTANVWGMIATVVAIVGLAITIFITLKNK